MRLSETVRKQIRSETRAQTNRLNMFCQAHNVVAMDYIPVLHAASLQDRIERRRICGDNTLNDVKELVNPIDDGLVFGTRSSRLDQLRRIFVVQTLKPREDETVTDEAYLPRRRGRSPMANDSQWSPDILGFAIVSPDVGDTVNISLVCTVPSPDHVLARILLAKSILFLGTVAIGPNGSLNLARHVRVSPTRMTRDLLLQIGFQESHDESKTVSKEREHEMPKLFLNDQQWNRLYGIDFSVGIYCGPSQRLNQLNQQWIVDPKKRKLYCTKYKLGTDYRKKKSLRYQTVE